MANARRLRRGFSGTPVLARHSSRQTISFRFNQLDVGRLVAMSRGMTRWFLLLTAILLPCSAARAQEVEPADGTTISAAQITGIDWDRLSPGLRTDIGKLVGTPLD